MIKPFSHSALKSNELVKASQQLAACITDPEHKEILKKRLEKTIEAANYLSSALNQTMSSVKAAKVELADQIRDDAFQAFKYGVLSASFRTDFKIKKAGEFLVEIVRKHGFNLYNLSYIAQSEAMKDLLEELEASRKEILKSGMTDAMDEMVSSNDAFDRIYHDKVIVHNKKETPNIIVGKAELSKQITLLLNHVELLEEDKPRETRELVNKLNNAITEIMEEVKERKEEKTT